MPRSGGNGGHLDVNGSIGGSGSITATGRFVTLNGNNTYAGVTYANPLKVTSDSALGIADGTAANGTVVRSILEINNASIGNEAIELRDFAQLIPTGTVTIDGTITAGVEANIVGGNGSDLTLNGPVLSNHILDIGAEKLTLNATGSTAALVNIYGLVVVGVDHALPTNANVRVIGTLDMNNRTASILDFETAHTATFAAGAQPLITRSVELLGELTLTDSFDGTTGTSYTIIRNDGSDPVIGEFNFKPEGASFVVRGQTYFITYKGNDGNDVVLHAGLPPPPPPPASELFIENASTVETNGNLTFHVTLSPASASSVTVEFVTVNSTATSGSDYVGTSGTLMFLPGETEKTIDVAILEDAAAEEEERFLVRLGDVTGNATIRDAQAIGTIIDDDETSVTTTHEYARIGNRALLLDLTIPTTGTAPYPVIVWIHAGQWRAGSRTPNPAVREVARGYAVAAVDYRFSSEAKFPAQIADVKAAVRWLRANAAQFGLDPQRIGAWGHGAGAHLAALLGTAGFAFDDPAHGNAHCPAACARSSRGVRRRIFHA